MDEKFPPSPTFQENLVSLLSRDFENGLEDFLTRLRYTP